ncbi:MAG: hypothetical protein ACI3ZB_06945 [Prevotella sp.]
MGGEEIYTRNKVLEAKAKGYTPIVFHSGSGQKIYIDGLKPFEPYCFPEFRYEPCVISKNGKKEVIKRICEILNDIDEESIIESHEIIVAEWAEYIAQQLHIRHLAYLLLEHNSINNKELKEFFWFKYNRHELVGIAENTLKDLFCNLNNITGYHLPAHCANSYEDIPCPKEFVVREADFTIGTIGRTNKDYVVPLIHSIIRFAKLYSNKSINVLYIGGSMNKQSEDFVKKTLSEIPNIKLYFTGMIFPIPIDLIRQADVYVSSAGSCLTSYRCGIPTISIDGNDSEAIGLFGITTQHSLFRGADEPKIRIETLLEQVLIKRKYTKTDKIEEVVIDFSKHWEFINEMSPLRDYFDIERINYPLKQKIKFQFLGWYYGLSQDGILYKTISKVLHILT